VQHGNTSTQPDAFVKRISVRSGGAGHALSGVIKTPDSKNGAVAGVAADQQATVLRSSDNIIVRLGT
jgi:hypothetical protein